MNKLYVCCTKPDCKLFQHTLAMVRDWGLSQTLHEEGKRRYLDVTIPKYWGVRRREIFEKALRDWPKKH